MSTASTSLPDAAGRFGPYGGCFVPETLIAALRQLGEEYDQARHDPGFQSRVPPLPQGLRQPPLAAVLRRTADQRGRRRPHLPQARGPQPHRRPQDQQLHRPGPADPAHGQAAHHRRDRRRTARRRHGHGLRPVRPEVPGLHGRGGRPPAEAQRLQDAGRWAPRSSPSRTGSRTLRDAINEAMRDWMASVATTHYILGSVVGPHPFPHDRPRFPVGHRPGGPAAVPRQTRPAARRGRRLRRRRQQLGGHVLSLRR